MPKKGEIDYSVDLELDLSTVVPSVAGPRRPQDRLNLPDLGDAFRTLMGKPASEGGYGKSGDGYGERYRRSPRSRRQTDPTGRDRQQNPKPRLTPARVWSPTAASSSARRSVIPR